MITDDKTLIEMRSNTDKTKREHYYKVGEYTFKQYYSTSSDCYNPFNINIYYKNDYVGGASGVSTIDSINKALISALKYQHQYRDERNKLENKIGQVLAIIMPEDEHDDRL
jgi:hypothetical protein